MRPRTLCLPPTFALLALSLGGCGDDTGQAPDARPQAADATPAFGASGSGQITLNGQVHALATQRCTTAFGVLAGSAVGIDAPDNIKVRFEFSPLTGANARPVRGGRRPAASACVPTPPTSSGRRDAAPWRASTSAI